MLLLLIPDELVFNSLLNYQGKLPQVQCRTATKTRLFNSTCQMKAIRHHQETPISQLMPVLMFVIVEWRMQLAVDAVSVD